MDSLLTISQAVPAVISAIVAAMCGLLAYASWRALVRTGNGSIGYVVAAFALMGAKSLAKALSLGLLGAEGPELELLFTLVDVTVVGLFAWPILRPRRTNA